LFYTTTPNNLTLPLYCIAYRAIGKVDQGQAVAGRSLQADPSSDVDVTISLEYFKRARDQNVSRILRMKSQL